MPGSTHAFTRRAANRRIAGIAVVSILVVTAGIAARSRVAPAFADGSTAAGADDTELISDDGLAPAAREVAPVRHAFPVVASRYTYDHTHHDYPATDIAVACGTRVVSAVTGIVWEVERVDRWNPLLDIPSTRGGRTVVVDGDDGVRYLFAHFSTIASALSVGQRVEAGQTIGAVGSTGRSTGCHLHVGLSPQCPTRVWDRLAGTVWPWPYLDAWRDGDTVGPAPEVAAWSAAHPNGCLPSAFRAPTVQTTAVLGALGE